MQAEYANFVDVKMHVRMCTRTCVQNVRGRPAAQGFMSVGKIWWFQSKACFFQWSPTRKNRAESCIKKEGVGCVWYSVMLRAELDNARHAIFYFERNVLWWWIHVWNYSFMDIHSSCYLHPCKIACSVVVRSQQRNVHCIRIFFYKGIWMWTIAWYFAKINFYSISVLGGACARSPLIMYFTEKLTQFAA